MTSLGLPRVHRRVLVSTNEHAKALAHAGAPHGTLVTADEQTGGRGRQGRPWVAPPGSSVLASVIVRGLEERHAVLPMTAAVAVCEAAEARAPVECSIKWPNDVWVARRKLAGILIEGRPQEGWAVLGVGLNVLVEDFPEDLAQTATSLMLESPGAGVATCDAVLGELLVALERRLGEEPGEVLDAWRARDALYGAHITWNGGEGTAAGIDDTGALLVDAPGGGRVSLDAGEVHLGKVA